MKNFAETGRTKADPLSLLLSTLGFGGIVYGFSSAGEFHGGWSDPRVLWPIAAGGCALIWFCLRQLTMRQPMLDLRTFQFGMFRLSVMIMMIVMMAMFSTMMLVPIFLQGALGYTPLLAGLAMLPGGVVMGIMSPITGRLFDRYGARWLAVIGLTLMAVTLCCLGFMKPTISYLTITILNTLFMLGISMLMMPVMTNGLNGLPRRLYPHGTAIAGTLQQVGGAIGMALLVTVMSNGSSRFVTSETSVISGSELQMLAMAAGMKQAFLLAFGIVVIALLTALFFLKRSVPPAGEGENRPVAVH